MSTGAIVPSSRGRCGGQLADVAAELERAGYELPLCAVLCFVDAEWGLFQRPFMYDRVLVTSPRPLLDRLLEPKTVGFDTTCSLAEVLASRFPPA